MSRAKNSDSQAQKRRIEVNLKGKLYPQDTILNTQKLLPIFLQSRVQSHNLLPKGNLSKVGTKLTTNTKVVSSSRVGAKKKDESQASINVVVADAAVVATHLA